MSKNLNLCTFFKTYMSYIDLIFTLILALMVFKIRLKRKKKQKQNKKYELFEEEDNEWWCGRMEETS